MGVCQTKLPVSTSIELKSPKVFIKTSLLLLIIKESFCCDLIKDEIENFQGPLAGIYSSMKWAIKNQKDIEWFFTAPSDTPFLYSDLVNKFLKTKYLSNTKIILAKNTT